MTTVRMDPDAVAAIAARARTAGDDLGAAHPPPAPPPALPPALAGALTELTRLEGELSARGAVRAGDLAAQLSATVSRAAVADRLVR